MPENSTFLTKVDQETISDCTSLNLVHLSAKSRELHLQIIQTHQNWTIEDRKNVICSDDSEIIYKQHESMNSSWIESSGCCRWSNGVGQHFLCTLWAPHNQLKIVLMAQPA